MLHRMQGLAISGLEAIGNLWFTEYGGNRKPRSAPGLKQDTKSSGFLMSMRHFVALIVLIYATLLSSQPAFAQFSQQGPKLVGTGATDPAYQGWSVAVSADGNTAIVGGKGDNGFTGAAWVWTRSAGVWSQQGKLVASDSVFASDQGVSVAISADGNTAIVGGFNDNNATGAAWVWTRTAGVWSQQGGKLVGSGAVGAAQQGYSVSLSADGNTAIVGGYMDNSNAGAAWVWARTAGVWSQQGGKLVGSGAAGAAMQGGSVSLSADGNTAIVGGDVDNGNAGAVWVWTRSGAVWSQQGSKLVGTGAVGTPVFQGKSVSLSADSNTAIVGGFVDDTSIGAAWVWTRTAGVWSQQGSKLVGTGAGGLAQQGISVSLSADGNKAIVGGDNDNGGAGAAWVWTRSAGVWSQQGSKLVGSGAVGAAHQASVSLSADGSTAIAGGSADNSNAGAAWVWAVAPPTVKLFRAYLAPNGVDTNPCTLAAPCRLLPAALAAVIDGGEVWMLASANYNIGPVYVDKSVTILAVPGALGSVVALGGNAINIATAGVKVALRNLVIVPYVSGGGINGINMTVGAGLKVENCLVANLPGVGISVKADGASVSVTDTVIRSNGGSGLYVADGARATVSRATISGNAGTAVFAEGNLAGSTTTADVADSTMDANLNGVVAQSANASAVVKVSVRDSQLVRNTAVGATAQSSGGASATLSVSNNVISNNLYGIYTATAGATVWASGNTVSDNGTGLFNTGSGVLQSVGDNAVRNNGTDASGVIGLSPGM
jgi:hypothetical protein